MMMRIVCLLFLINIACFSNKAFGQSFWDRSEVGFSIGGMEYKGGEPNPSMQVSGGVLGKYYINNNLALRAQLLAGTIVSNKGAIPTINNPENKEFKLGILDFTIMPEYDFVDVNSGEKKFTPYVFLGLGYFYYTQNYNLLDSSSNTITTYKYTRSKVPPMFNVPLGAGFKYAFSPNLKAFIEGSTRIFQHQDFYAYALGMTLNLSFFKHNSNNDGYNFKRTFKLSREGCPPVYQ